LPFDKKDSSSSIKYPNHMKIKYRKRQPGHNSKTYLTEAELLLLLKGQKYVTDRLIERE
jgi:hypothetical protein